MAKRKSHAHRSFTGDGGATCECGKEFGTDDLWRAHYEEMHDENERALLEGRDPEAEAAVVAAEVAREKQRETMLKEPEDGD